MKSKNLIPVRKDRQRGIEMLVRLCGGSVDVGQIRYYEVWDLEADRYIFRFYDRNKVRIKI